MIPAIIVLSVVCFILILALAEKYGQLSTYKEDNDRAHKNAKEWREHADNLDADAKRWRDRLSDAETVIKALRIELATETGISADRLARVAFLEGKYEFEITETDYSSPVPVSDTSEE